MLRNLVLERRPKMDAVGLDTRFGLDEGQGRVLDVEVRTLGKRVINAFYTKRL